MVKFCDDIPDFLLDWIPKQEIFWVATAPLAEDGHVNVSPKGLRGSFHVESPSRVWYEDMTGSGSETIAHLRENGRITIMFSAFDGPPRIVRLFGVGTVYEWGTPEYTSYIPDSTRKPGSRSIIAIDIHKVGSSCGYAVPYFAFQGHRTMLLSYWTTSEKRDMVYELEHPNATSDTLAPGGVKAYWKAHSHSIDGLPSVTCYDNTKPVTHSELERVENTSTTRTQIEEKNTGRAPHQILSKSRIKTLTENGPSLLIGFLAGLATAAGVWKLGVGAHGQHI